MKIQDIMTRDPSCVTADATVREAAQLMKREDVGIIPVVDSQKEDRLLGVVTDRDIAIRCVAEGKDGRVASESFEVGLVADPDALPKVTDFHVINKSLNYLGNPVYFVSFTARNPEEVSIDPPAFPVLHRAPYGRFYIAPRKTTTYTLTVTGKFGHKDQKQLTLEGPR